MSNHRDFRASIISFCQGAIDDMKTQSLIQPTAQYYDFDAMAELADVPKTDVLGMMNFHWHNDGSFYNVGFSLGVSTWGDKGLIRHNDILDYFEPLLRAKCQLPLLDAKSGTREGWLVITNGTSLMPMAKTITRPVQFLLIGAAASRTT